MVTVDFDGSGKCVIVSLGAGETDVSINVKQDIYSDWKVWALSNTQYEQAFIAIGGQDKGGGISVGSTFFLKSGWNICIQQVESHTNITFVGELLPEIAGESLFDTALITAGQATFVERQVPISSEIVTVNTGGAEADWTASEKAQIRDALGVTGSKTDAAGGQLQKKPNKTFFYRGD